MDPWDRLSEPIKSHQTFEFAVLIAISYNLVKYLTAKFNATPLCTCTSFHLETLDMASQRLGDKPCRMFCTRTRSNDWKINTNEYHVLGNLRVSNDEFNIYRKGCLTLAWLDAPYG